MRLNITRFAGIQRFIPREKIRACLWAPWLVLALGLVVYYLLTGAELLFTQVESSGLSK